MSTPFGEYHLVERIAAGGMAEIWRAEIRGIGGFKREVAIKRILPEHTHDKKFVDMLLDEARIAARLSHPNIAQVIQCGLIDGCYYIVMELVDGVPLSQVLALLARAGERLPHQCALHLGIGLLRALDCAHKARGDNGRLLEVVHRDVSPHNLLVSTHGDAKLIDFGVAQASDRLHKTETGVLKGKISYMAPEHLQGGLVDARTDQYAAALVIAEMLTGRKVHGGQSEVDVLRAVLDADSSSIGKRLEEERVPAGIVDAVVKALARRADDRFADCGGFAAALLAALAVDVESARPQLAALVPRVRAERRYVGGDGEPERPTKRLTPSRPALEPVRDVAPEAQTLVVDPPLASAPAMSAMSLAASVASAPSVRGRAATLALAITAVAVVATVAVALRTELTSPPLAGEAERARGADARDDGGNHRRTAPLGIDGGVNAEGAGAGPDAGAAAAGANVDARFTTDAALALPTSVRTPAKRRAIGTLDLACLPWCEIAIDGRGGLRSPLRAHVLDVGEHDVEVVNPPTGKRAKVTVHIEAGRTTRQSVRLE